MLGLSDTTIGMLVSVMLHAGVAAAFLGPLGDGEGPGAAVVMVSIDAVESSEHEHHEPSRSSQEPPSSVVPQDAQGALQSPQERQVTQHKPPPRKRPQRPPAPPASPLTERQIGESGGGGLLGTLYSQPVMRAMPKPAYPQRARQQGHEGKVSVRVWVAVDGTVERAEVTKSSGSDLLDQAARESALEAEFNPAVRAGVPTAAEKTMVVTFSLTE